LFDILINFYSGIWYTLINFWHSNLFLSTNYFPFIGASRFTADFLEAFHRNKETTTPAIPQIEKIHMPGM
jgi:hypothetical protein